MFKLNSQDGAHHWGRFWDWWSNCECLVCCWRACHCRGFQSPWRRARGAGMLQSDSGRDRYSRSTT